MRNMNIPLPKSFSAPAEFILNSDLCRMLQDDEAHPEWLQTLAEQVAKLSLQLDKATLQFEANHKINRLMSRLENSPDDVNLLEMIGATIRVLQSLTLELDLQQAQNVLFAISMKKYSDINSRAESGEAQAQEWIEHFKNLALCLNVVVQ